MVRICDDCAAAVHSASRDTSLSTTTTTATSTTASGAASGLNGSTGAGGGGGDRERCIVCNGHAISDAFYCHECVLLENDREGCPRVINVAGSSRDLYFEKKKRATQSGSGFGGGGGGGGVGGRMAF